MCKRIRIFNHCVGRRQGDVSCDILQDGDNPPSAAGHDQPVLGACHRNVQDAHLFGFVFHVYASGNGAFCNCGIGDSAGGVENTAADPQLAVRQNRGARVRMVEPLCQIRKNYHREFKTLGFMNCHQPHRAACGSILGRNTLFTHRVQIAQKAAQPVVPAGFIAVGKRQEGVQISGAPCLSKPPAVDGAQHQPRNDLVQKPAQRNTLGKVAQFSQQTAEIRCPCRSAKRVEQAAVPVLRTYDCKVIRSKTCGGRKQDGYQRNILSRIVNDLQQSKKEADFFRGKEIVAAAYGGDSMALQGIHIDLRFAGERTHQNHDILRAYGTQILSLRDHGASIQKLRDAAGDKFRLNLCAFHGRMLWQGGHVDAVQLDRGLAHIRIGAVGMQSFRVAVAKAAGSRRHGQPEDIVRRGKNRRMGEEIIRQQDFSRFPLPCLRIVRETGVFFQKNTGVRQTEAINRLLHVSDKEKIFFVAGNCPKDCVLHAVGILILVDHDFGIVLRHFPRRSRRQTAGMGQQTQGFMLQIVIVQHMPLQFALPVPFRKAPDQQ